MDKFVSKLSLYDILSMVIPGGAIFLFLSLTLGYEWMINGCAIDSVLGWTIALVVSYLLGLINHVCTAMVWHPFRNCPAMLRQSLAKVHGELCPQYLIQLNDVEKKRTEIQHKWLVIVIGIGIPITAILFVVSYFFQELDSLQILPFIGFACCFVWGAIFFFSEHRTGRHNDNLLRDFYYAAYYFVADQRCNSNISIMEGQVAFMQNMLSPLVLFYLLPAQHYSGYFCLIDVPALKTILAGGILLMVTAVFYRQEKIYKCVWEDYEYLKRLIYEKNIRKNQL